MALGMIELPLKHLYDFQVIDGSVSLPETAS